MASLILHRAGGSGVGSGDCTGLKSIVMADSGTVITNDSGDVPAEGSLPRSSVLADNGGTMINRGEWTGTAPMNSYVSIPVGYHNGSGKAYGPTITVRVGSQGTAPRNSYMTIPKGYHDGTTTVSGPTMTDVSASTTTLTSSNSSKTINAGSYLTGAVTVKVAVYDGSVS